ncbi:MAG: carboxy terminal-processing peptidase, partial [Akkermansia sp.]
NKKVREQENASLEERRKSINQERKTRFAQMAKDDAAKYKIYRLTLDDINAPELPLANPEKDNEQFMHVAEDPTAELDDSPEYPSGLDPELREGINIVQDMLKQQTSTK